MPIAGAWLYVTHCTVFQDEAESCSCLLPISSLSKNLRMACVLVLSLALSNSMRVAAPCSQGFAGTIVFPVCADDIIWCIDHSNTNLCIDAVTIWLIRQVLCSKTDNNNESNTSNLPMHRQTRSNYFTQQRMLWIVTVIMSEYNERRLGH